MEKSSYLLLLDAVALSELEFVMEHKSGFGGQWCLKGNAGSIRENFQAQRHKNRDHH
jgi:hypothetical protein